MRIHGAWLIHLPRHVFATHVVVLVYTTKFAMSLFPFRKCRPVYVFHQAETAHKLVSKLNPGLGNKYEKAKMLRDIQGAKNVTTVSGTGLYCCFFLWSWTISSDLV